MDIWDQNFLDNTVVLLLVVAVEDELVEEVGGILDQ